MLRGSHPAHSICMDVNIAGVAFAHRVGEIKQNPVRMGGRFKRRFHRNTERDFNAQSGVFAGRDYTLQDRCLAVLRHGTRQQKR